MKRYTHRLLWLFAVLLLANGCTKEDDSDCIIIKENTIIYFKLNGSSAAFTSEVTSVDAFIFDESKKFFESKRFNVGELNQFAGWRTNLPVGDYYVVCWGNVGDNSRMNSFVKGATAFDEAYIQIPNTITTTGNPIFYAPYKLHPFASTGALVTRSIDPLMADYGFHVEAQKENTKEMFFGSAHRTINVYIMGYSSASSLPATITGTQLCAEYGFYYNTHNVFRNFTQVAQAVTTPDGAALLATFYVGFSEVTNSMNFILSQGSGGVVLETVNLLQFLADHPDANTNVINILIKFSELGVTISMPGWGDMPVIPGI